MEYTCNTCPSDVKKYLITSRTFTTSTHIYTVLNAAIVRKRTAYLAVRTVSRIDNTDYVSAVVVLIKFRNKGRTLCYKDIPELMGPIAEDCPAEILDLLTDSPHLNHNAKIWRENCRNNVLHHKSINRHASHWKPGMCLRADPPISLNNGSLISEITLRNKRTRFFTYGTDELSGIQIPRKYWLRLIPVSVSEEHNKGRAAA